MLKRLKEKILIDDAENSLMLSPMDEDGFCICEVEGDNRVYVYYSEVGVLIDCIRRNIIND